MTRAFFRCHRARACAERARGSRRVPHEWRQRLCDGRRRPHPNSCCLRSSSRKCGRPASRISEAARRGWKNRRRRAGSQFYDLVYNAERPELFFKAAAWRVVGPGGRVRIRRDARWNVPEPELALLISPAGRILGYTIGNDMSSRDIEGENPLYLPQAKVYDGSCALGPCIAIRQANRSASASGIHLEIRRGGAPVFAASTTLAEMKRDLQTLVDLSVQGDELPARLRPADRHRCRSARRLHAPER